MDETEVNWKIRGRIGKTELEVVGPAPDKTKEWFDELSKKYLGK